jgi:hypothetical protein
VTVLRRTLDGLAAAAGRIDFALAADAAVAPLLGARLASLAEAGMAARIDRALHRVLGDEQVPAPAGVGPVRPPRAAPVKPAAPGRRPVESARAARRPSALPEAAPGRPVSSLRARRIQAATRRRVAPPGDAWTGADAGLAALAARIPGGAAAARTPLPPPGAAAGARLDGEPVAVVSAPSARVASGQGAPAAVPGAVPAAAAMVPAPVSSRRHRDLALPVAGAPPEVPSAPEPAATGIVLQAAPRAGGGQGIAGLAAWWREHEAASEAPAPAADPAPPTAARPPTTALAGGPGPSLQVASAASALELAVDPLAHELDGMDAFARALERVLIGEARRHGVPLEDP